MKVDRRKIREYEGMLLQAWIDFKGVTQVGLAEAITTKEDPITGQIVNNMTIGRTQINDARKARIAHFLGISSKQLEYGATPPEGSNARIAIDSEGIREGFAVTYAIRHWSGALAGLGVDEATFYEDGMSEVPTAFLVGGTKNAELHDVVTVAGTSMSPRISSGDKVLFFRNPTPRPNTIVLCQSNENTVYVKVLRQKGVSFSLDSINPEFPAFTDLLGWKIHGYAVAIIGDGTNQGRNIEWMGGSPLKA